MTKEIKNNDQDQKSLQYINPIQNMAVDVFVMYQQYWKKQQQTTLEYWTQILKTTYNPWDVK
jgi:hypothetical protein